jgi:hypothetical protein
VRCCSGLLLSVNLVGTLRVRRHVSIRASEPVDNASFRDHHAKLRESRYRNPELSEYNV